MQRGLLVKMETDPNYMAYKKKSLSKEEIEYREMSRTMTTVKGQGEPVAEIRDSPADRQLGSAFGSKLEIVGLI